MLRSLRDGAKSTPMRIFLVALAVGFALWGIDDVFRAVGSNDKAVQVGKVNVTALEAAQEFDRTRRRYLPSSSSSEAVAAGLLNSVMTGLVQHSLFIAEAERMDLTVTRRMEKQTIAFWRTIRQNKQSSCISPIIPNNVFWVDCIFLRF